MKWVRQGNKSTKSDIPTINIRRKHLALNVELIEASKAVVGDYAEVFIDEDERAIGIKFFKEDGEDRYKLTPDGGGKARVSDVTRHNVVISCQSVATNPAFSALVGTKQAKLPAKFENGLWVAYALPTWKYTVEDRKPVASEIGVYRYLLDDEVVYIGQGRISQRVADPARANWNFDRIEYLITDSENAVKIERVLLDAHVSAFGRLPFYNKVLGVKTA